ncbi:MAG: acylphosphatase, partial [Terracidiphilus sp.]
MTRETQPKSGRHEVTLKRCRARVRGVVQGVGFRPFVYRLALEERLAGFIGNDTGGVSIEIQGPPAQIESFLLRLRAEAPALARIDSIDVHEIAVASLDPSAEAGFRIVASQARGHVATGIPADAATCPDCLRELFSPADRRYRYPFLNCTNCGPRFTITRRIPYDRPQTSMAQFKMCAACQAEYDDPANRRFHAQPNACWDCGPRVWLEEPANASVHNDAALKGHAGTLWVSSALQVPNKKEGALAPGEQDPIARTIDLLLDGQILAIKGIGGFHLCVDAANEAAVMRLRQRKRRYGKPLAIMVRDLSAARSLCALSAEDEALLAGVARPIVLA